MKVHSFRVEGEGNFPFDMLRYDSCWPATAVDCEKMFSRDRRVILMLGIHEPTVGRWQSFLWRVVPKEKSGLRERMYPSGTWSSKDVKVAVELGEKREPKRRKK